MRSSFQLLLLLLAVFYTQSASADISQLIADAAKVHLGATRPRITEDVVLSLPPLNAARLNGEFEFQKDKLIDDMRERVAPKSDEERIERGFSQRLHEKLAMRNIDAHLFNAKVVVLRGQTDFLQHVFMDKHVWLVAFINGERDADVLTLLDRAAGNLAGVVKVAVVDYAMTDWKLRQAWTIAAPLLPQLRLFQEAATITDAATIKLPRLVSGLEKEPGHTLDELPEVSLKGRAWTISHAVSQIVEGHSQGEGARLKSKEKIVKSEL